MNAAWIILTVAGLCMFWLYVNGYMYVQNKRALVFYGDMPAKNSSSVSFTGCTGTVSRVIKCREPGIYRFESEGRTSKGSVCIQILDGGKIPLLILDDNNRSGKLAMMPGQRYYLLLRFLSASGDCKVHWEKE